MFYSMLVQISPPVKVYVNFFFNVQQIVQKCNIFIQQELAQSAGVAECTDCISAERQEPPLPMSVLDMIKQSDGEAVVILELWGMWSTPLLLLLPGSLRP